MSTAVGWVLAALLLILSIYLLVAPYRPPGSSPRHRRGGVTESPAECPPGDDDDPGGRTNP